MNIIALILLSTQTANAPTDQVNERYLDCVNLIEADTEVGRIAARQWASAGGGADAQHCLAIADIASGFPRLGAIRLEEASQRKDAGDDYIRARLLAQASYAWLQAADTESAKRTINEAFSLVPDSGELHMTAAKIHAALEEWQQVISSVTIAEQAGFSSSENYVLRGRAFTHLGAYETAAQDVVNALSLNPVNIEALVLRGEIQQTGIAIEVYYDDGTSKKKK